MVNGLHVSTDDMSKNGADTVRHANDFQAELNSLKSNIEGLMSIWRGTAADDFYKSYVAQANYLTQFQELLDELGVKIGKSADLLYKTEEENANAGARLFDL